MLMCAEVSVTANGGGEHYLGHYEITWGSIIWGIMKSHGGSIIWGIMTSHGGALFGAL